MKKRVKKRVEQFVVEGRKTQDSLSCVKGMVLTGKRFTENHKAGTLDAKHNILADTRLLPASLACLYTLLINRAACW